jgi:hypothetical protein
MQAEYKFAVMRLINIIGLKVNYIRTRTAGFLNISHEAYKGFPPGKVKGGGLGKGGGGRVQANYDFLWAGIPFNSAFEKHVTIPTRV